MTNRTNVADAVENFGGSIRRCVIDDDDLLLDPLERNRLDALDHGSDRVFLVIGRNDDGDFHPWNDSFDRKQKGAASIRTILVMLGQDFVKAW